MYKGMLEWYDEENGYVRVFWADMQDIGTVVEQLVRYVHEGDVEAVLINQVDPCAARDLPDDVIPQGDNLVYLSRYIHSFSRETIFTLPYGVIASMQEGEISVDQLVPGYTVQQFDDGLVELTIVVSQESLVQYYEKLLDNISDIRVFWVELHQDWENALRREIYTNESLSSSEGIKLFLRKHRVDTVLNGYVTLTAYSDEGAANVSITDHKVLRVLTFDSMYVKRVAEMLDAGAMPYYSTLATIEYGLYHWHYRHPSGKDRKQFIEWLHQEGFSKWKQE